MDEETGGGGFECFETCRESDRNPPPSTFQPIEILWKKLSWNKAGMIKTYQILLDFWLRHEIIPKMHMIR